MSRLNPGRLACVRVLASVERGAHAEDLLADLAPPAALDRRLAWHLCQGVLRRQGTLDHLLAPLCSRPLPKLDPIPRNCLRMGLFELLWCRTPAHAVLDQAVEASRRAGSPRASGLVNAILRRASKLTDPDDPWLDLPDWLGSQLSEHEPWVRRLREPAPHCGVWKDPTHPVPQLETEPVRAGGAVVPGAFCLRGAQGRVDQMPGFADGKWWVMDPAAAQVADFCVEGGGESLRILDACAAPGGKSFRLATQGHTVTAVDVSSERIALLQEGAQRLSLQVDTHIHDWLSGPMPDLGQFDVVLVDAPCTGLGTLRRHPEIRWRRQPSDPAAMMPRQLEITRSALAHVAPGGVGVYAVCSPAREEGPGVVEHLMDWNLGGSWSSFPPQDDEDAFQAFRLESK